MAQPGSSTRIFNLDLEPYSDDPYGIVSFLAPLGPSPDLLIRYGPERRVPLHFADALAHHRRLRPTRRGSHPSARLPACGEPWFGGDWRGVLAAPGSSSGSAWRPESPPSVGPAYGQAVILWYGTAWLHSSQGIPARRNCPQSPPQLRFQPRSAVPVDRRAATCVTSAYPAEDSDQPAPWR